MGLIGSKAGRVPGSGPRFWINADGATIWAGDKGHRELAAPTLTGCWSLCFWEMG